MVFSCQERERSPSSSTFPDGMLEEEKKNVDNPTKKKDPLDEFAVEHGGGLVVDTLEIARVFHDFLVGGERKKK